MIEVLIADDESDTRDLLADFCRGLGFAVVLASDGRAAITAIERAPAQFGIVLTDLNMPGADGFEVLRAARKANVSCYVVIITGYAALDTAVRAVHEGAYDYLAKPFSLGQLGVVMARITDRMALEGENRELAHQLNGQRPAAPARNDIGRRLDSIDERLGKLEDLLRARLTPA